MNLHEAQRIAEAVAERLRPSVVRIEIAGSVRREKREGIKDVELVIVPRQDGGMFHDEPNPQLLQDAIDAGIKEHLWVYDPDVKRYGDKLKRFRYTNGRDYGSPIRLDVLACPVIELFIAEPRNFGNIFAIRTGNSDWSRLLVTPRDQWAVSPVTGKPLGKGLMPVDLRQAAGLLFAMSSGIIYPCPEERDFFNAIGIPFVEPRDRNQATANKIREGL